MNAKYYRFQYHNRTQGVLCTGSMADCRDGQREEFSFLYIAGGSGDARDTFPEQGTPVDLLILSGLKEDCMNSALSVIERCRVDRVLYPACKDSNAGELLIKAGAARADAVDGREEFVVCRQRFCVLSLGEDAEKTLVLYHGSEGCSPEKEECMMTVKPQVPGEECALRVDPDNLSYEMRCALSSDFVQCRKHNRKDSQAFVDGHLLLAAADLSSDLPVIRRELDAVWSRIRFVGMPKTTKSDCWSEEILTVGAPECAQYFMGDAHTLPEQIKAVVTGNPYRTFISADEGAGLCVFGCYVKK